MASRPKVPVRKAAAALTGTDGTSGGDEHVMVHVFAVGVDGGTAASTASADVATAMTTFLLSTATPLRLFGQVMGGHFFGGRGDAVRAFRVEKGRGRMEEVVLGDGELSSVERDDGQVNVVVCRDPLPVPENELLAVMKAQLTPTDAVLATVRELKAEPTSLAAVDAVAGLWAEHALAATPIIFGLILASGNTAWSEDMRDVLTAESASHALAWLVKLFQDPEFQVEFNKHVKPLHLRHLHRHLTHARADVRDVALLFIGQLQCFAPKLQNYTQYIPRWCIADVTEFLLSFIKPPDVRYAFSPATASRLAALIDNHEEAVQLPQIDEAHIARVTNGCILVDPESGRITTSQLNRLFTDVADPTEDDAAAAAAAPGPAIASSPAATTTPAFAAPVAAPSAAAAPVPTPAAAEPSPRGADDGAGAQLTGAADTDGMAVESAAAEVADDRADADGGASGVAAAADDGETEGEGAEGASSEPSTAGGAEADDAAGSSASGKAEVAEGDDDAESAFVTVSGATEPSPVGPHPCADSLVTVVGRRATLTERLAEKRALIAKLEAKGEEMSSLRSALLGKIAGAKKAESKKKNELKLSKLSSKFRAHKGKLAKAVGEAAEMERELRSVRWQQEATLLVSLLHSLIDSVARDDDATDIKEQQDGWKSQLLDLGVDVVTASTYVGMVGLMKAGKSSTISGLVGCDICPSRATALTVIPTIITHVEGVRVPQLMFPPACVEALLAAIRAVKDHLARVDGELKTQKKEMDDLLALIYANDEAIQFSVAPIVGVDNIQHALVVANDVVRLCEYLELEGANPLAKIADLHDLPSVEVEFAVMAETGMFGRLSFIDSPGPNEFGMAGLGDVVRRTLKQASIIAVVLNYAALAVKQQADINEMVREATEDLQQEIYVFVNKYDQRNTASGDMNEDQLRDYIARNIKFGAGSSTFARENIFPVSAKYAQFANTARAYLAGDDGEAIADDEIEVPDPDEMGWVKDFARIAWGETWSNDKVYPAMMESNDMKRFRQGVDAVWRSSRLNEPLESMLRHCYTNAGVISLQQSLSRCHTIADSFALDLNYQIATVTASVAQLESFLIVSASAYDDIRAAIVDIKRQAVELALKRLPWLILDAIESASDHMTDNPATMLALVKTVIAEGREPPAVQAEMVAQFDAIFNGSDPLVFTSQEEAEQVIERLTTVFKAAAGKVQQDIINKILTNTKKINYNIGQMVKQRLKPHLRQYEAELERVLSLHIEFPDISPPSLEEFSAGIQASTLKLLEQPTTRQWAVKWLLKFIPVPWFKKNKTSSYEVVPARIREAFDSGLRRVFDATLNASQELSTVLQRVVDEYGGTVEAELNVLIARIRQSIARKRGTVDRSIYVKHLCEEQLWKVGEYYRRVAALALDIEKHAESMSTPLPAVEYPSDDDDDDAAGPSAASSDADDTDAATPAAGDADDGSAGEGAGDASASPAPQTASETGGGENGGSAGSSGAGGELGDGDGDGNNGGGDDDDDDDDVEAEEKVEWGDNPTSARFKRFAYKVGVPKASILFPRSQSRVLIATDLAKLQAAANAGADGAGPSAGTGKGVRFAPGSGAGGGLGAGAAAKDALARYDGVGESKKTSYLDFKIPWGEFDVGKELGRGAFGAVFEGRWKGRAVAVKEMRIRRNKIDVAIGEVEVMWKLRHPNLVEFIGFSTGGGAGSANSGRLSFYVLMELATGGSLRDAINSGAVDELPLKHRVKLVEDIALGLEHMHERAILHRDLKPGNVLLVQGDERPVGKLCDFGVSKAVANMSSAYRTVRGSPIFMDPSLLKSWSERRGKARYGASADIFAFAMCAYELLALLPLIECAEDFVVDDVIRGKRPEFPPDFALQHPDLVGLIKQCWHNDPNARPTSAQLVVSLHRVMSVMGIS